MIAPEGYRPFMEFSMMAHEVAEGIANDDLRAALDEISFTKGSQEHHDEMQSTLSDFALKFQSSKYKIIDAYILGLPRLYVCSTAGNVLEISKQAVLLDPRFYEDDRAYVENFDNQFECVDTFLWSIDCQKLAEHQQRVRDLIDPHVEAETVKITERSSYIGKLRELDGWSLCVRDVDFPKNAQALQQSCQDQTPIRSDAATIVRRILSIAQTENVTKSFIRNLFPHLSARQFEHHWRLAAEKNPDLSKPGRKS